MTVKDFYVRRLIKLADTTPVGQRAADMMTRAMFGPNAGSASTTYPLQADPYSRIPSDPAGRRSYAQNMNQAMDQVTRNMYNRTGYTNFPPSSPIPQSGLATLTGQPVPANLQAYGSPPSLRPGGRLDKAFQTVSPKAQKLYNFLRQNNAQSKDLLRMYQGNQQPLFNELIRSGLLRAGTRTQSAAAVPGAAITKATQAVHSALQTASSLAGRFSQMAGRMSSRMAGRGGRSALIAATLGLGGAGLGYLAGRGGRS